MTDKYSVITSNKSNHAIFTISGTISSPLPPKPPRLILPLPPDELEFVDKNLPSLVAVLPPLEPIWKASNSVCLCGLLHSYSNSNTNLAIFDPSTGREVVRTHVGTRWRELVDHLKLSEIS
ncbi:hypothetical protein CFP56_015990 [Quercus suber]|uniref:F-box protein n=1 Tax=Quercus suber TaxID=58331 RepID=A0AAW0KR60_QUESU